MDMRRRMAAGLLLAVVASGAAATSAAAVTSSTPATSSTVSAPTAKILKSGPREWTASSAECSARATFWTERTRFYHFCRYKDGSDGFKAGWWVWEY